MENNSIPKLENIKNIIAISSCKGGVGKSTIAAHFALELVRQGKKVGLLDADLYGPSLPTLFGLENTHLKPTQGNKISPIEKDGLKLMSFGFLLGNAPAILRGPIVTRYVQQFLFNTHWGELDYLIIDLPPGTGDIHITITQMLNLSGAVIVTTPHTLSLIDVARGILMFEKVHVPILGIVENMSYFQTEDQMRHYVFGQSNTKNLEKQFGVSILNEIPLLPELAKNVSIDYAPEMITKIVDNALSVLEKRRSASFVIPHIDCDPEKITLTWQDGKKETVSNFDLRLNSQDALSVSEMTGRKILKAEHIRKDIRAQKVIPVGNYAIGIDWNDGHSAGIYTYELISELASQVSDIK